MPLWEDREEVEEAERDAEIEYWNGYMVVGSGGGGENGVHHVWTLGRGGLSRAVPLFVVVE